MKTYKTTIVGIGPYCVEFDDGEIITTRSKSRQNLISAAPELLEALRSVLSTLDFAIHKGVLECHGIRESALDAIAKAEGKR